MTPVKEAVFERVYDAPLETVWRAWTEPQMLKEWWGPNDVSIPECEVDLRVGGRFYIVMEAGEAMGDFKGIRWPMEAKFTEIDKPTKLAYSAKAWTEGQEETTQIDQISEITMSDDNGKTKVTVKVTINKVGPGAGMAIEGMKYGFTQQLEKLNTFLSK